MAATAASDYAVSPSAAVLIAPRFFDRTMPNRWRLGTISARVAGIARSYESMRVRDSSGFWRVRRVRLGAPTADPMRNGPAERCRTRRMGSSVGIERLSTRLMA